MTHREAIAGVVLAGGQSRRMGAPDKFLQQIGNRTLIEQVIARIAPQTSLLLISANGDLQRLSGFSVIAVADSIPGFAGPLAGILSAMEWLRAQAPRITHLVSVPCDTPWLPDDLVARLDAARQQTTADIVVAASEGREHPVCALWPVAMAADIRAVLVAGGPPRALRHFQSRYRTRVETWASAPVDPFFNVNTPEDLQAARRYAGGSQP